MKLDNELSLDLAQRLGDASDLDSSEIQVRVEQGVITLCGWVEDHHAKWLAIEIAETTRGVLDVRDRLAVRPELGEENTVHRTEFETVQATIASVSVRFRLVDSL
jgi:hypothetical protein